MDKEPAKKEWRLIDGRFYYLAEVFDNPQDATLLAKKLKPSYMIVMQQRTDGWAVWWSPRLTIIPTEEEDDAP
ncbi:MAG: hypothetical protein ACXAEF_11440 [Candidatus Thorarchaeota archaeon]|jgi:hypothetical protein